MEIWRERNYYKLWFKILQERWKTKTAPAKNHSRSGGPYQPLLLRSLAGAVLETAPAVVCTAGAHE